MVSAAAPLIEHGRRCAGGERRGPVARSSPGGRRARVRGHTRGPVPPTPTRWCDSAKDCASA